MFCSLLWNQETKFLELFDGFFHNLISENYDFYLSLCTCDSKARTWVLHNLGDLRRLLAREDDSLLISEDDILLISEDDRLLISEDDRLLINEDDSLLISEDDRLLIREDDRLLISEDNRLLDYVR